METIGKKLGFFSAFIIPALVISGFYLGGYWNLIPLIFSFLLLPAIDQSLGTDTSNVSDQDAEMRAEAFYYRFITYIWTFVQVCFLFWGAHAVTSGRLHSLVEWFAFLLGFALVTGGIGITVAHELGHKKPDLERFYAKLLLMTVCYMHFYIEHNRGHHVHDGTDW